MIDQDQAAPADDPWAGVQFTQKPDAAAPAADPWAGVPFTPKAKVAPVSTAEDVGRSLGAGTTEGVQGIPLIPSALDRAAKWLSQNLPGAPTPEQQAAAAANPPLSSVIPGGFQPIEATMKPVKAAGEATAGAIGSAAAGTPLDPAYQTQTFPGQAARTTGQFLASGMLPIGEMAPAARLVRNVAAPAAGAVLGGELGKAVDHPELGRITGAIAGAGVGSALVPGIERAPAEAAERLGVQMPVGSIAGAPSQAASWALEKFPGTSLAMYPFAKRALTGMGEAASGAAEAAGAGEPAVVGQAAKDALANWKLTESQAVSQKFTNASSLADPNVTVPMTNTQQVLADIMLERQQAGLPPPTGLVDQVRNSAMRPGGINAPGIQTLKTTVGQQIDRGALLPADTNMAELKRVYGAIKDDQSAVIQAAGGPQAQAAYADALHAHNSYIGRLEAAERIVGADASAQPEQFVSKVQAMAQGQGPSSDIGALAKVKNTIGPAFDPIAATIGGKMGIDPATGIFSPSRFAKDYAKYTDAGKTVLFGAPGTPGLRSTYDDLALLGKWSGGLEAAAKPGWKQLAGAGAEAAAGFFHPVMAAKALAGLGGTAAILGRAATASSFGKLLQAYKANTLAGKFAQGGLQAAQALEGATRNFANTANSQLGSNIDPDQLNRELSGGASTPPQPVPARP